MLTLLRFLLFIHLQIYKSQAFKHFKDLNLLSSWSSTKSVSHWAYIRM